MTDNLLLKPYPKDCLHCQQILAPRNQSHFPLDGNIMLTRKNGRTCLLAEAGGVSNNTTAELSTTTRALPSPSKIVNANP